jgi:hypothetical protein
MYTPSFVSPEVPSLRVTHQRTPAAGATESTPSREAESDKVCTGIVSIVALEVCNILKPVEINKYSSKEPVEIKK